MTIYVVPIYPVSYFEGSNSVGNKEIASIEKSWKEKGETIVDLVKKAALTKGIEAESVVIKSALVAETILKVADEKKCDLIVMASHGYKGVKRVLLGSETQHVLTQGNVPVLVLH